MLSLIADGEPYKYLLAERTYALLSLTGQPTIVEKGQYVVIDRHFNTYAVSAQAWDQVIKRAFKQFKRKQSGVGDENKK